MNYNNILEIVSKILYYVVLVILAILFIYVIYSLLIGGTQNYSPSLHTMPSNLGLPSVMYY